jgi:nucleoside-diphosphate kinase
LSLCLVIMQKTLIIFKPDCMEKGNVGAVLSRFEKQGFAIRACKLMQLTHELLVDHYSHVADKPFFPEIEKFMSSRPVLVMVLQGDNVIDRVRGLLGPTDSRKAEKGTVRGDFGTDMMVNVLHASDGPDTAEVEIKRFFKPEEVLG